MSSVLSWLHCATLPCNRQGVQQPYPRDFRLCTRSLIVCCDCGAEIPRQEGEEGNAGKGKGKSGKANGTKASPAAPALTGKEKAQAIIDAAFAEVKQDMARKANTGHLLHIRLDTVFENQDCFVGRCEPHACKHEYHGAHFTGCCCHPGCFG